MIEFRAVSKRYADGTMAVDKLSLTVEAGSITVFVGPSGCGKTTSLRMVNRMIDPTAGSILLDGKDIRGSDPALLRRRIGYVIQQAGLFPHRTVRENVATVPLLSGWTRRRALAAADELLDRVGLSAELGSRYPAQLSGGQQQRVGVARALAADPPVLLMDEPFSAVDPVVREDLQQELLRLQAELAKTIVFVTHDIDEAVRIGDRVAVFRQGGRLAQYAAPAEVLRYPADDFVSGFVGRDRGYRGLSFVDGREVVPAPVRTVSVGSTASAAAEWVLVLDDDRRPRGWLPPGRRSDGVATEDVLIPGGSLYAQGAPLRGALDAALSSPAGLGVVVDADGRHLGVVGLDDVLALIKSGSRTDRAPAADRADRAASADRAAGPERTG